MLEGKSVMHGEVVSYEGEMCEPQSVEWAFMHRQTCQAQLAPCDPVREKARSEQWYRSKKFKYLT